MKLCTFRVGFEERIGAAVDETKIVDLTSGYAFCLKEEGEPQPVELANIRLPPDMIKFLRNGEASLKSAHLTISHIKELNRTDLKGPDGRKIVYKLDEVKLLAPIPRPPAIFIDSWGKNEEAKIVETKTPLEPTHRLLVPSATPLCVIGYGDPIIFPRISKEIFCSVELAVVVGKPGFRIDLETAEKYIAGYTIVNDVTMWDILKRNEAFHYTVNRAKAFPSSKPMGPWLVLKDQIKDPLELKYKVWINDKLVQKGSLNEYRWTPAEVVASASQYYPIAVGYIYLMGALPGATNVLPKIGDIVRLEIEGIGVLENTVIGE